MKLTRNADQDKYGYIGYNIGFDVCSQFSWSNGECGKNVFGVDNSSSVHDDNKKISYFLLKYQPEDQMIPQ